MDVDPITFYSPVGLRVGYHFIEHTTLKAILPSHHKTFR
jgi:hypothetical protein